jgi:hypothetical protein
MPKRYEVLTGLTYPIGEANVNKAKAGKLDEVTKWKRAEPGEVVDDIPAVSIAWLLEQGQIAEVK